jgi:ATP-dependent DNA helicase DinG
MISIVEPQSGGGSKDLVREIEEIFSPTGILSRFSNFEFRLQQQSMAMAVASALLEGENLLVEAGTGVGKSLGYLIPAILFATAKRKKAVVSTHTINLQEQLTEKDLPMLAGLFPDFKFCMLKGRANYLCLRRLHKAVQQVHGLFTTSEAQELQRIYEWSKETTDGSLSDFDLEPDPKVWSQVCSERGLCSPKSCGPASEFAREHGVCFFQRARQKFLAADVLVLNHTLLFTLLGSVDDEMESGILFKNDFVIFDEAHTVEQVASRHIGLSVSNAQLRYTLHRLWNPRTQKGLLTLVQQGGPVELVSALLEQSDLFFGQVEKTCENLIQTQQQSKYGGDSKGPVRAWTELRIRKPDLFEDTLTLPLQRLREALSRLIKASADKDSGEELIDCNRRLAELRDQLGLFLGQSHENYVYWVERSGRGQRAITLKAAPVDVAEFLKQRLFERSTSVIMTSATLSMSAGNASSSEKKAGGRGRDSGFGYFAGRVGAVRARQLQLGSPYDYEKQMKLFLVNHMAEPRQPGYEEALVQWIKHFVRLTHGKAFVLFTNSRLMQEIARIMAPFFEELKVQCLVQGGGIPRSTMLERFKEDLNSVLFGTDSFWQGVDVPGEALSNVIITRLPFAVPDHPLIEARLEHIEAKGGNSFMEFSLPEAVLKFRQGVGRLIRGGQDKGIVVVLDNRILNKRYGQLFLAAVPKCPVEVV